VAPHPAGPGGPDPDLAGLPADAILILYDGVCALCNGVVRFLLARDRRDRFRFAALQSELGQRLVRERGGDPEVLSTLYLIERPGQPEERVFTRGRAGAIALSAGGGAWRLLAVLRLLPDFLLNAGYGLIARLRYRLAGRLEACPVPPPEHRHRFL
jgi:predicted DCC family thiol-disulfide oxidoreductase YuxK